MDDASANVECFGVNIIVVCTFTLAIPAAAADIVLKIARLFLDAPVLAKVLSMNLCETVSNAAEKPM